MNEEQKKELRKRLGEVQKEYYYNKQNVTPLDSKTISLILVNIGVAVYNFYLFSTDFSPNTSLFNYVFTFLLLLLNIPLFIFFEDKRNSDNRWVAIFMFVVIMLLATLAFFAGYNNAMLTTALIWIGNYLGFIFFADKKRIANLQGQTGCAIFFWIAILIAALLLSRQVQNSK